MFGKRKSTNNGGVDIIVFYVAGYKLLKGTVYGHFAIKLHIPSYTSFSSNGIPQSPGIRLLPIMHGKHY
jgi:hypothetical protein